MSKVNVNEIRSNSLINAIARNKGLDLNARVKEIQTELLGLNRTRVLAWFHVAIDLNHAKLHGLGTKAHADRDGGWGFAPQDDNFLSSLRMQHLGHIYSITTGPGYCRSNPLTAKQVHWIAKILARPFYAFQLALIHPGDESTTPRPEPKRTQPEAKEAIPF